jgi:hypothetical protein
MARLVVRRISHLFIMHTYHRSSFASTSCCGHSFVIQLVIRSHVSCHIDVVCILVTQINSMFRQYVCQRCANVLMCVLDVCTLCSNVVFHSSHAIIFASQLHCRAGILPTYLLSCASSSTYCMAHCRFASHFQRFSTLCCFDPLLLLLLLGRALRRKLMVLL